MLDALHALIQNFADSMYENINDHPYTMYIVVLLTSLFIIILIYYLFKAIISY